MYPVLYKADETDFTSLGLGTMRDAIKCLVTEERNGIFELEMEYPANGLHFNDMEEGMLLKAKPNDNSEPQRFRIYKIEKSFNGRVTVYAEHISYALNEYPVDEFDKQITGSPQQLWNQIRSLALPSASFPFTFEVDGSFGSDGTVDIQKPCSLRSLLGGSEGSILDAYSGEYEFDNECVIFHKNRGVSDDDSMVTIRYGKNLTGFDLDISTENMFTQVFPYARKTESFLLGDVDGDGEITSTDASLALQAAIGTGTLTREQKIRADIDHDGEISTSDAQAISSMVQKIANNEYPSATTGTLERYIFASADRTQRIIVLDDGDQTNPTPLSQKYGFTKTKFLDLTDVFDSDYNITEADVMEQAENYISTASRIKEPKVSLSVSFQPLGGTSSDDIRSKIEKVGLCDSVRVVYPRYGFDKKLKVNRTVFDVLLERYKSMDIGDPKSNFADTIREQLYSD